MLLNEFYKKSRERNWLDLANYLWSNKLYKENTLRYKTENYQGFINKIIQNDNLFDWEDDVVFVKSYTTKNQPVKYYDGIFMSSKSIWYLLIVNNPYAQGVYSLFKVDLDNNKLTFIGQSDRIKNIYEFIK